MSIQTAVNYHKFLAKEHLARALIVIITKHSSDPFSIPILLTIEAIIGELSYLPGSAGVGGDSGIVIMTLRKNLPVYSMNCNSNRVESVQIGIVRGYIILKGTE